MMIEYKRVCAWCKKSMGTLIAEDNGLGMTTTHGMCDSCFGDFTRKAAITRVVGSWETKKTTQDEDKEKARTK